MRILCVLCRDPFSEQDGATYAIKSSFQALSTKGEVFLTGFGPAFRQSMLGGYPCCGSLGEVSNSPLSFARSLLRGESYSIGKYSNKEVIAKLSGILKYARFDVIWYEQTQAAAAVHASGILRDPSRGSRHVLRSHNIEHRVVADKVESLGLLARPLLKLESALLRRSELTIVDGMDAVLAITNEDREALLQCCPQASEKLLHWPVLPPPIEPKLRCGPNKKNVVLFVGNCNWGPNLKATKWIIKELAPMLYEVRPEIMIRFVGAGTKKLQSHNQLRNLEFAGYVDDLSSQYSHAICSIAPIWSGGGINIKVLESLSHGVPVVGTHFGRRGISSSSYILAENARDFAKVIVELTEQPHLAEELAALAKSSATTSAADRFDDIWGKIVDRNCQPV